MLEGGQGGAQVVALGTLAMSAGAIGQLIANPTDVLKVRMQSDGRKVKCLDVEVLGFRVKGLRCGSRVMDAS
jgi:hypothetical protein